MNEIPFQNTLLEKQQQFTIHHIPLIIKIDDECLIRFISIDCVWCYVFFAVDTHGFFPFGVFVGCLLYDTNKRCEYIHKKWMQRGIERKTEGSYLFFSISSHLHLLKPHASCYPRSAVEIILWYTKRSFVWHAFWCNTTTVSRSVGEFVLVFASRAAE